MEYALPYLRIRALAFLPSLISTVGFSAFRGKMDTITPLKISGFANLFNAILDPIMIFKLGWGVSGAAAATVIAEFISFISYIYLLGKAGMVRLKSLFALPSWTTLKPLVAGGASVQLRAVALNIGEIGRVAKDGSGEERMQRMMGGAKRQQDTVNHRSRGAKRQEKCTTSLQEKALKLVASIFAHTIDHRSLTYFCSSLRPSQFSSPSLEPRKHSTRPESPLLPTQ